MRKITLFVAAVAALVLTGAKGPLTSLYDDYEIVVY